MKQIYIYIYEANICHGQSSDQTGWTDEFNINMYIYVALNGWILFCSYLFIYIFDENKRRQLSMNQTNCIYQSLSIVSATFVEFNYALLCYHLFIQTNLFPDDVSPKWRLFYQRFLREHTQRAKNISWLNHEQLTDNITAINMTASDCAKLLVGPPFNLSQHSRMMAFEQLTGTRCMHRWRKSIFPNHLLVIFHMCVCVCVCVLHVERTLSTCQWRSTAC